MEHRFKKHYSRDEARALLPQVKEWLSRLAELRAKLDEFDERFSGPLGSGQDLGGESVNNWVRTLSDTKDLSILCLRERSAVTLQDRQRPFPASVRAAPPPGVFNFPEASHPRFASSVCRKHPHPLVSRGCRCGTLSPQVEHVSGAWVLCAYLLVSDRRPRIAAVGYRASGAERRESCELRPPLPGCSKGSSRID